MYESAWWFNFPLSNSLSHARTHTQCLNHFKFALRQQSPIGTIPSSPLTPPPFLPLSVNEAALQLCRAVHQLHFQLLVLLGCYIKLLGTLKAEIERCGVNTLYSCVVGVIPSMPNPHALGRGGWTWSCDHTVYVCRQI